MGVADALNGSSGTRKSASGEPALSWSSALAAVWRRRCAVISAIAKDWNNDTLAAFAGQCINGISGACRCPFGSAGIQEMANRNRLPPR